MVALSLIVLFLACMALGIPVSMSIGLATSIALLVGGYTRFLYVIPQQMVDGVDNFSLLAIPFFILAGNLMNVSGITDRIFNFLTALVGHLRGGLAQVNVLSNMVFAGISGSAVADAAALGVMEIKAMTERGYSRTFSAALSAASSVVGPIIPPSIPLIIYAYLSDTSVARLFLAGIIPGIIIGISLMATNYILSIRQYFPRTQRASWRMLFRSAIDGAVGLMAPAIILGAILGGIVTATEAGVLASTYAILVGILYGGLNARKLWSALHDTVIMTTVIMFIIAFSTAMGWLFAFEQIPQLMAKTFISLTSSKYVFLGLVLVFLLIIGFFLEGLPAMLILLPLLLPLADQCGIDRVHFGLVVVVNLSIGILTPPMGIVLFIIAEVAQISFEEVLIGVLPFLVPLALVLCLITFLPELSLFLPNLLLGKPGP